jgi:muconate cycloisomerase
MDSAIPGWPFAKAPIDVAAHDLLGQAMGVPVYQLLGGKVRDHIPLIWPIGSGSPEENAQEALAKVEEGYRSLHIKVGASNPEDDIARVGAIREAVGEAISLMVDANQGWDRSTAIRTIRKLEGSNLSMVEQPVPAEDLDGMTKVQGVVDTPISADESLRSIQQALELIRRDAARVFSLKTGKSGGLFRTRQIAAIAEAAGLPCFVNSMIEMGISVATSLHVAASVPNLVNHGHALMSNLRIDEDILVPGSFQYDGKNILVPRDCKGLGVKMDDERLDQLTKDHFTLEI